VRPLAVIAVVVVGFVALSLWTFWLAVRPFRIAVPGAPAEFGLRAEDLRITVDDGVVLAAWLIPARGVSDSKDAPVVLLLHGYPAEKSDLLPIAAALHDRFTTVLVDFRYFGESGGRATTLGYRERHDISRVIDQLAIRGITHVGIFGYSLGGAVALLAAAEDPRIAAVAAWAPFSDLRTLARELYAIFWVSKYPFVELMRVWARLFLGADITSASPAEAAARLRIPVLLLASRDDEQIPFAHAERLRAALAANPRAEFAFGRGLHNERIENLERRLESFFLTHLRVRPGAPGAP
jgi:dipeptidyl aminopeptidase/acylaminoacyl peptidase